MVSYSLLADRVGRCGQERRRRKVENLHGRRAAGGVSITLSSCNIPVGWIPRLMLLEALTSASNDEMGMVSASWVAIPNWALMGISEGRTGVQKGLEKQ